MKYSSVSAFVLSIALLLSIKPAMAADRSVSLRLSAVTNWQSRNDVQIPSTDAGTRFSFFMLLGTEGFDVAEMTDMLFDAMRCDNRWDILTELAESNLHSLAIN